MSSKVLDDRPAGEPLPMPRPKNAAKISRQEWDEYRELRAAHRKRHPDYERGWDRPAPSTAEAVWSLISSLTNVDDVFPPYPAERDLVPEQLAERRLTIKQALTVTVSAFVGAARDRQMVTKNLIFDLLARRWSDHFRKAVEEGRAFQARDMTIETVQSSLRDLVRNDIRFKPLWQLVTNKEWSSEAGGNPLFYVKRLPYGGYQVFAKPTRALRDLERLLRDDPSCCDGKPLRVLLGSDRLPRRRPRREICAERAYNLVNVGPRAQRLIELQEQPLLFDIAQFRRDYESRENDAHQIRQTLIAEYKFDPELSDWTPPEARTGGQQIISERKRALRDLVPKDKWLDITFECERYDHARGDLAAFSAVYHELDRLQATANTSGLVEIKSAFELLVNRRYQALNFWPTAVSAKADQQDFDNFDRIDFATVWLRSSERARWFRFPVSWKDSGAVIPQPLQGVDVSSSQTQILAVVLGLDDLEEQTTQHSFKRVLAKLAWDKHADPNDPFTFRNGTRLVPEYTGGADERLLELVKELWMRRLYGGVVRQTVRDQYKEPSRFGPGWTKANADLFLASVPWYAGVKRFLDACEEIGRRVDRYEGAIFVDPLDRVQVRWNPVARVDDVDAVVSDGQRFIISRPGRNVRGALRESKPNAAGDYPVDRREVKRKIAPCLVHMLDAYFSSLVMEHLDALGLPHFIAVHDCWYVPYLVEPWNPPIPVLVSLHAPPLTSGGTADPHQQPRFGATVLRDALCMASEEWLKGLGPVYDRLVHYLGSHPVHGPLVHEIRAKWQARVREQRWPQFAVAESQLIKGPAPASDAQR